jgi:hypothetical protein
MRRRLTRTREEARRLFLAAEATTNVEIAARLKVKPHTVGRWRTEEDWDSLRIKIDRRAAELFVEKIATDRVTLNVRHYRVWELLLARLLEDLKGKGSIEIREMERIAGVLDRAQKGQRLAKGMAVAGETEEAIKAEGQAEIRRLIDTFVDAIKENVPDEEARERIRQSVLSRVPVAADDGAGHAENSIAE